MRYLKKFNDIFEGYGSKTKFYHKGSMEDLESFKNGINLKYSIERGQGEGFYVFNDLDFIKNTRVIKGPHHTSFLKPQNCIIEIESILNETNFDLDYELVKSLEKVIESVVHKSGKKTFEIVVSVNNEEQKFVIVTDEELNNDDFIISQPDDDLNGWIYKVESNKTSNFGYYKKGFNQESGGVSQLREYIDSFDRIGIKNEIEKECFKLIDKQPMALRYVGPKIYPTRYIMFDDKTSKWGDWNFFNEFIQ